jgi:hypothetical protein
MTENKQEDTKRKKQVKFKELSDEELDKLSRLLLFSMDVYVRCVHETLGEEMGKRVFEDYVSLEEKIFEANKERNGVDIFAERDAANHNCTDSPDVFLDFVGGEHTIQDVKTLNSSDNLQKMQIEGYPDKDKYIIRCRRCLCNKYKVDPRIFDIIQTFDNTDTPNLGEL